MVHGDRLTKAFHASRRTAGRPDGAAGEGVAQERPEQERDEAGRREGDHPPLGEVEPGGADLDEFKDQNIVVTVRGDKSVPYGKLIEIMDVVRMTGIKRMSLATTAK